MARKKRIRQATDQRKFTLVYHDFMESKLLDYKEKLIFIAIKRYANNETLKAFPSLKTISGITGISQRTIQRCIEHMVDIGVISVEHRVDPDKGNQSNVYTLYDFAEIWDCKTDDELIDVADKVNEAKMIAELKARGYIVSKVKEPADTYPTKGISTDSNNLKQYYIDNTTINTNSSQDPKYTEQDIKEIYDYDLMIEREPHLKDEIESVLNIIYDILNTTKKTIRVAGTDKPSMVVISRIMRLEYSEILYCIKKYMEQTDRIINPRAYMITLLYGAKEQMRLDMINQVNTD